MTPYGCLAPRKIHLEMEKMEKRLIFTRTFSSIIHSQTWNLGLEVIWAALKVQIYEILGCLDDNIHNAVDKLHCVPK